MKLSLIDLTDSQRWVLDENKVIEVPDDHAYQFIVECEAKDREPELSIGDFEIDLPEVCRSGDLILYKTSSSADFFKQAFLLNYFGQSQITLDSAGHRRPQLFTIKVNVLSYKADIAKSIMDYLSNNVDDIVQSCFSRSHTGYNYVEGEEQSKVKLVAIEDILLLFDQMKSRFIHVKRMNLHNSLEFNSNRPVNIDDTVAQWLTENVSELGQCPRTNHLVKVGNRYFNTQLPNAVKTQDTDLFENRVLHHFCHMSLDYVQREINQYRQQVDKIKSRSDISGDYISFDNVASDYIRNIYSKQLNKLYKVEKRLRAMQQFFHIYIPVKKNVPSMPIQNSFTLRHVHYRQMFEYIKSFYEAKTANRSKTQFLLGLRNLSQLFELAGLYYLVNYFRQFSAQVLTVNANHFNEYGWQSESNGAINVLANRFIFEKDDYLYELVYEKNFYSYQPRVHSRQLHNLVRTDDRNNFVRPDFTIKVINKASNDYYFIVLDTKFSRPTKMGGEISHKDTNIRDERKLMLNLYYKYGVHLKALTDNGLESKTRLVSIMFGLAKTWDNISRKTLFKPHHDIDGSAPMLPYVSADFINLTDEKKPFYAVLDKYIER